MTREDVINKVFPHSLFGYDPVAVDAFLDEVIREFDRLTNTVDVLQFRLAQELGEAKQTNDMLAAELLRADFASRVNQLTAGYAEPSVPPADNSAEYEKETEQTPLAGDVPFVPADDGEAGQAVQAEEPTPEYDLNADFDPEIDVGPEPERLREAEAASRAFEEALEREVGEGQAQPVEEVRLMTRAEIRRMVRDEKKLERRMRRKKNK